MTMKKDGIQTRNRKLSSKSKKKRSSVVDFFSPFVDNKSFCYSSAATMGMGGYMSQYYGQCHQNPGQFTQMYAAPGTGLAGLQMASTPVSSASTAPFGIVAQSVAIS